MKKHYPWLCFDADGTLFDDNRAEATALKKTFQSLRLPYESGYSVPIFKAARTMDWIPVGTTLLPNPGRSTCRGSPMRSGV